MLLPFLNSIPLQVPTETAVHKVKLTKSCSPPNANLWSQTPRVTCHLSDASVLPGPVVDIQPVMDSTEPTTLPEEALHKEAPIL